MQTIRVSSEFSLNRRMRKAVQRGKLQVVREGEENSSTGGEYEELEATKAEFDKMRETKNGAGDDTLLAKGVLTLNEKENAIDYLTMAIRALVELRNNSYAWKWVLISLHGAIYGFAICAAKCSDGGKNVVKENGMLLPIWDVIKICQDEEWMNRYTISKPLVLSDEQREALKHLCDGRNRMAHFPPNLHMGDLPDGNLVIHCLEVVKAIALGTCTVLWTGGVDEKKNVEALCEAGIVLARNYIWADEE